jgi:hypothetical protein
MRRDLILVGGLLTTAGIAVLVAAFIPSLYPVWTARGVNAVTLIGQHRGTWQVANWLFAAGAALTLAGLGVLTRLLNHPLGGAALTLMTLASTLWIANLAFRLTVTVRTADLVSGGGSVPEWYEQVNAWAGGLWYAAALTGAVALVGYGVAVTGGGVLPAWTGWLAVGFGVLMLGLFLITGDAPPILLYLAPTVFGVTALIHALTGRVIRG